MCRSAVVRNMAWVVWVAGVCILWPGMAIAGSTLWVNTTADENSKNSTLSLREALLLAAGDMTRGLSTDEKNKVQGGSFIFNPITNSWTVNAVNGNVGRNYGDTIRFESGVNVINVTGDQLKLGQTDNIDGDRGNGAKVVLDGGNRAINGLRIFIAEKVMTNEVKNLEIRYFGLDGIAASGEQNGQFLGLVLHHNGKNGLSLDDLISGNKPNPRNNKIGGIESWQRNYIYSNGQHGIYIRANTDANQFPDLGNTIANCYIGLKDSAGTADYGNGQNGILLDNAFGNMIGGNTAASRNVISGNNNDGIKLQGANCNHNLIYNNYIGTMAAGNGKVGNGSSGIALVAGAGENYDKLRDGNIVGGAGKANLIGGNRYGIYIANSNVKANRIYGNWIGVNSNGANLGNSDIGITLYNGTQNNSIEGSAAQPVYICFNGVAGIDIADSGTSGNTVRGCRIGSSGTVAWANGVGIRVRNHATNNTIGETGSPVPNQISGNTQQGVSIYNAGTTGNKVLGNYIGTQNTGGSFVPNGKSGVYISQGAAGNEVTGNTISGNNESGVHIRDIGTDGNMVRNNKIGTNAAGTGTNGNLNDGVAIAAAAKNNEVSGNLISSNTRSGVVIFDSGTTGNKVSANKIGINDAGTSPMGNRENGVLISDAANNDVFNNVISGNYYDGVLLVNAGTTGNKVYGNKIGTNPAGTAEIGNQMNGVKISGKAKGNSIGYGTSVNLISGNAQSGVQITDKETTGNLVIQCLIGLNANGTAKLPNKSNGVSIWKGASGNIIGGSWIYANSPKNIIAGNAGNGVYLGSAGTSKNLVVGNMIGTVPDGNPNLGNGFDGVAIGGGPSGNTVGGGTFGANLISGNDVHGVSIGSAGTTGNRVIGNVIGLNPAGTAALPNKQDGVSIYGAAFKNSIGGPGSTDRNVISGNQHNGVSINRTTETLVQNNYIGSNRDGTTALGNARNGVMLLGGASLNRFIGNVISGNTQNGVHISNTASRNTVSSNKIGTNAAGNAALGNILNGVWITQSSDNTVGGTNASAGNLIAYNGGAGICVLTSTGNSLRCNSIHSNTRLGIDLEYGKAGVTPNDTGDADTGPNELQNFPVITGVDGSSGGTVIKGKLDSQASGKLEKTYVIDFYFNDAADPTGYGEGKIWLGSKTVSTNTFGSVSFTAGFPSVLFTGQMVTATATDASGNTSEFSAVRRNGAERWALYR